jgi:hypothetical protein
MSFFFYECYTPSSQPYRIHIYFPLSALYAPSCAFINFKHSEHVEWKLPKYFVTQRTFIIFSPSENRSSGTCIALSLFERTQSYFLAQAGGFSRQIKLRGELFEHCMAIYTEYTTCQLVQRGQVAIHTIQNSQDSPFICNPSVEQISLSRYRSKGFVTFQ